MGEQGTVLIIAEIFGGILFSLLLISLFIYLLGKIGLQNRLIRLVISALFTLVCIVALGGDSIVVYDVNLYFVESYYKYSGSVLFATLLHLLHIARMRNSQDKR